MKPSAVDVEHNGFTQQPGDEQVQAVPPECEAAARVNVHDLDAMVQDRSNDAAEQSQLGSNPSGQ